MRSTPDVDREHHRTAPVRHPRRPARPGHARASDTPFFPANTTGEWHVQETLRKVFVVMAM
jgi:uncharacterized cupin superfamily protein